MVSFSINRLTLSPSIISELLLVLFFYALWCTLQNAIQEAWHIEQEKEAMRWYVAEEQEQEVYKDSHPTNQAKVDGRTSRKKNVIHGPMKVLFVLLSFEQMRVFAQFQM